MQGKNLKTILQRVDAILMWSLMFTVTFLIAVSILTTTLLLLDSLRLEYIAISAVVIGILIGWWLFKLLGSRRHIILPENVLNERVIATLLFIVMILMWGVINVRFTSEHIFVNRDPGIYALGAIHLSNEDDLDISAHNIFGGETTTSSSAVGKSALDENELYFQGLHLLPALLGVGGKVVGAVDSLKLNVLFGVTALIALYLFASRMVRPYWALVAASIFAVSMPLLYFSRDTYTEPLAATFTFTGMLFMWLGLQSRSRTLWLTAGLAIGASALTRIDGYLAIAAALFFIAFFVALGKKAERKERVYLAIFFGIGTMITGVLGWLDLLFLSSGYFFDLYGNFMKEMYAICVALIGIVALCFVAWRTSVLTTIDHHLKKYYVPIISFSVLGVALLLTSRQFWDETFGIRGVKNFNELTAMWPAWYLGDALVALSLFGIGFSAYRLIVKREISYLIPISIVVLTSALYLVKPSIATDQIWASRRLVPVILPGLIVFAMISVDRAVLFLEKKFKPSQLIRNTSYVLLAAMIVMTPLSISRPLLVSDQYTQFSIMEEFCQKIPQDAAVVWLGTARWWALQSSEEICDIQSAGLAAKDISAESLKAIEKNLRAKDLTPVFAIFSGDINPDPSLLQKPNYRQPLSESDKTSFEVLSRGNYNQLENTIIGAPRSMAVGSLEIYAAGIEDGKFVKLRNE